MLVRASSGSGGSGSAEMNELIMCDMYGYSQQGGVGFYDGDYLNLVSGAIRTSYSGITNAHFTFKKSGKISLYYCGGTNDPSNVITLNGNSIKPTTSNWKTDISVSVGDTLEFMLYTYYSQTMILFKPDMSVYTGDCPYST